MVSDQNSISDLTAALQNTSVTPSGVSFAGKSLKLNSEDEAKEVVEAIEKCKDLHYLNLEGNTLGVDACKGIAKALEKHPEFKRAQWKDMFTGRMKTEIPKALEFLGNGLVTAQARLTELDLSDNAFGPIGVKGLASLLRSSSCYALQELRLNNNGLGITGGKLLAAALTDCYVCSKKEGKPLALKVFIAGRNRLENEGAVALASVFKMIGSLEEIAMPQNGIYHLGISALSEAFTHNKNLEILNLNDNTIGPTGSKSIAEILPSLQNLREINFGDCLLKTKGAFLLANALMSGHNNLETLNLSGNEIRKEGGIQVVKAMKNKIKLKLLNLDANQFGSQGREQINDQIREIGKVNVLGSLDDDESEDSEKSDESDDAESETESVESEHTDSKIIVNQVTIDDFLKSPTAENFIALGDNKEDLFMKKAKIDDASQLEDVISILMKVSSLSTCSKADVAKLSLKCTETLYREIFTWAEKSDNMSIVNNSLLVNLGLIKSEDKKKPSWNLEACLNTLQSIISKNYFPISTKNTLKVFIQRELDKKGDFIDMKKKILSDLSK